MSDDFGIPKDILAKFDERQRPADDLRQRGDASRDRMREHEENSATAIRMLGRAIEARLARPFMYELASPDTMRRMERMVDQFLETLCVNARSRQEASGPRASIAVGMSGQGTVRLVWPGDSPGEQSDAQFNYGLHLYEDIVKNFAFPGSLERGW